MQGEKITEHDIQGEVKRFMRGISNFKTKDFSVNKRISWLDLV